MSKSGASNYKDNADLVVNIIVVISYILYMMVGEMLKGARAYLNNKK